MSNIAALAPSTRIVRFSRNLECNKEMVSLTIGLNFSAYDLYLKNISQSDKYATIRQRSRVSLVLKLNGFFHSYILFEFGVNVDTVIRIHALIWSNDGTKPKYGRITRWARLTMNYLVFQGPNELTCRQTHWSRPLDRRHGCQCDLLCLRKLDQCLSLWCPTICRYWLFQLLANHRRLGGNRTPNVPDRTQPNDSPSRASLSPHSWPTLQTDQVNGWRHRCLFIQECS